MRTSIGLRRIIKIKAKNKKDFAQINAGIRFSELSSPYLLLPHHPRQYT